MERVAVSLVGAGPGDPGLITLKGAQRLRSADVVYYDALVPREILALCRRSTRLVPAGKRRGFAPVSQEQITARLIEDARAGLRVVRLKGGDPFVFGRGGEEGLALLRAGISFEVVPGVCSGIALPALAGIPLTHRGLASSAAFLTAHDLSAGQKGKGSRRRLKHLARGADTLVIFMARAELARVGSVLIEAGLAPDTPAALIENGSTPREKVRVTRLREIGFLQEPASAGKGPSLLIVGPTVALSDELRAAARQDSRKVGPAVETRRRAV